RTCGPPGASTNSRVLGATSAHLRARGAKVSLWQPGSPGSQSRSSICGHDDGTTHTGAAPSPDRHTQPPSQPPRPARRPTPPRGPASRLALDDGAGGGRCLRPDEAHTFAVSGYVIPGVPGSPGAIPVPPAAVGDARVALRAELVRRGVGVPRPVRRQRGGDRRALRGSARRFQDAEEILRGLVALDVARDP